MNPPNPLPYGILVEKALARTRSHNEKIRLEIPEMALAALSELRDKNELTLNKDFYTLIHR
jgi:hypothetical protein